ncbi:MAG: hypothetical protein PUF66_04565 [Clostridium sp.]|nr:hypothetical protein [Clostridium sp.]
MKEATGELNMTVVTIVLIGVITAFFTVFWPTIRENIQGQWEKNVNSQTNTVTPR